MNPQVLLDLDLGTIAGGETRGRKTLGDLAQLFAEPGAVAGRESEVVYETFGCASHEDADPPRLLYSTTIIQPGDVAGEAFLTRGHYHVRPERGELVLTLRGRGLLLLKERDGTAWTEPMKQGSIHDIDGRWAHRVANVGDEPLVFFVAWMSDCGHDYEEIARDGFGLRPMIR